MWNVEAAIPAYMLVKTIIRRCFAQCVARRHPIHASRLVNSRPEQLPRWILSSACVHRLRAWRNFAIEQPFDLCVSSSLCF